ncbi:MAG: hypothetical protein DI551_00055 [Micavibrio aeruginosavorus]|uniref:Uncharacterized protein n=1 Tax=Micavibrio aeruginosavorus TaxID=349221 RepID=A0A2W5QCC4_9BACT|nr:MAG: hypothetical protein DI551_00055 [Micavibrio aeruginosavorus]
MADLSPIFARICGKEDQEKLKAIDLVAFDVIGTLVDHNGKLKRNVLSLYYAMAARDDVQLRIISSDPIDGREKLVLAGARHLTFEGGVRTKSIFYDGVEENKMNILVVDNEPHSVKAENAVIIDPTDPAVVVFLQTRAYRPGLHAA